MGKQETWFEAHHKTREDQMIYEQEGAILEASESLWAAIEEEGISHTDIATRLNKSKAFVSQVLAGGRNLTLRTFADFAWALGRTVSFSLPKANYAAKWHDLKLDYQLFSGAEEYRSSRHSANQPVQASAETGQELAA